MSDNARQLSRLQQVVRAAERIHSTLDLDTILSTFLELSVRELECEGGTIYRFDRATGELESRRVISTRPVGQIRLKPGQGIAGRVAASGEPAIVEDTSADGFHTKEIDQRYGFETENTIAFPLKDEQGGVLGVLQLVNKRQGGFSQEDTSLLHDLSVFVALAIRNATIFRESLEKARLDEELEVARRIQETILPRDEARVPGFEIAAAFVPCHETAGDYYHVFPAPGGTVLALMDVSGKGVGAAMVSYGIHAFLSVELGQGTELAKSAVRLNEFMLAHLGRAKYATGILLRIGPEGGVEYVNGGHPAMVVRGVGGVRRLGSTGMPFGLLPNATYRSERIELSSGDCLALFSDGYTETVNEADEEFGPERLEDAVAAGSEADLAEIVERLHRELATFQGTAPTPDDRTLVLLGKQ